jgi:hypothetical protein
MRVIVLWILLTVGAAVFLAMLVSNRWYKAIVVPPAEWKFAVEYASSLIPWLIVVLCAAPAVHRVFTTG